MKAVLLLLSLSLITSTFGVELSQLSGKVCLGAVSTWTCTVNGSTIGWRNLGRNRFHFSVSSNLDPLGSPSPFSSRATSVSGGTITSLATANLTSNVNGTTLDCSDGSFLSNGTNIDSYDLILKDLSAVTSVSGNATKTNSEVSIDVSWQEATCAAMYDVVITHESGLVELTNTTTETSFVYNVPSDDDDCYTFSVYSIDFLGMRAGSPASTRIGVRLPFFLLILKVSIVDGSTILTMSIEATPSVCQPDFESCNISLTNDTFRNETDSCSQGKLNVTVEDYYDFTVTVYNFLGNSSISDNINITGPFLTTLIVTPPTVTVTVTETGPENKFPPVSIGVIVALAILLFVMTILFVVALLWGKKRGTNAVVGKGEKRSESPDEKQTKM